MAGLNLALSITAIILALIGLLCLWWRSRTYREIRVMMSTPLSTAAQAAGAAPGTVIKIAGALRCQTPILSEFTQTPCAYFKVEITREEVYYDRDSDGKERRNTRTITIHSNTQNAACAIGDDSGLVGIDFTGASVEAVKVLDRIGNPNTGSGVMGILSAIGSAGDRYTETILTPESPVFVLAEAREGQLIGAPAKGSPNKVFVISHKTEQEHTKDLNRSGTFATVLTVVFFAAAIAALVWAWKWGP